MSQLSQNTRVERDRHASFDVDIKITNPPIIDLFDVVKIYESPAGRYTALKGIDLSIKRGEFVAVVGKSGSGKSTLMNMITGIDRPTSGKVYINEVGIHKLREGKIASWRGKTLGIVFQFFQLLPTLTVIENVMLPMDFCNMYSIRERNERALRLLEQVELQDQAYKLPSTLSGGQQQRVAIARALANDPPILVADEPTGNLDSKTAGSIFSLFTNLVKDGKTILMVTHDQDLAKEVSRIIYLVDGRIVDESFYHADDVITEEDYMSQRDIKLVNKNDSLDETEVRSQISMILDDLPSAADQLQLFLSSELLISANSNSNEEVYRILMDEIGYRARSAESDGKPELARAYWKVLLDATDY